MKQEDMSAPVGSMPASALDGTRSAHPHGHDIAHNMRIIASRLAPSEMPALGLKVGATYEVIADAQSVVLFKIHYSRQLFAWEIYDAKQPVDAESGHRSRRKIEVPFHDVLSCIIINKEGTVATISMEVSSLSRLFKEINPLTKKNTQWTLCDDFTGTGRGRHNIPITITVVRENFVKRLQGRASCFDKLMSCDQRLRHLIETCSPPGSLDSPKPIRVPLHLGEGFEDAIFDGELEEPMLEHEEVPMEDQGIEPYAAELSSTAPESKAELMSRFLKPRKPSPACFKKSKFRCPGYKCYKPFATDGALRQHIQKRHPKLIKLGLDVGSDGTFKASPKFVDNVLIFARRYPTVVRQVSKDVGMKMDLLTG